MHARQQVAKQLVGLRIDDDALPDRRRTALRREAKRRSASITSSTISPILSNAAIALAYLKKPFFNAGTVVTCPRRRRACARPP